MKLERKNEKQRPTFFKTRFLFLPASPKDVCIIEGFRSPFVKAGSLFKEEHPAILIATVFKELLNFIHLNPQEVDEVILGNVGASSDSANISRVAALYSGLPESVSAFTVHRNCASALQSLSDASFRIQSGEADVILAGGTESMSGYPLLFSQALKNTLHSLMSKGSGLKKLKSLLDLKFKDFKPRIALLEGLTDPFSGLSMGDTAEVLAKEFGISREEQDQFALESHQKAVLAEKSGRLKSEIVPILTKKNFVDQDKGPRENQSLEKLKKLPPYFDKKHGTVTAGNACSITDGAVGLLLMSRKKASSLGYKPQALIRSSAYAGCDPRRMGLGPVWASPLALKKASLSFKDIGLFEINEAFSAQVLACLKAFSSRLFSKTYFGSEKEIASIDPKKLNVNGGAVALGHPVGATGSRLVLTLMREMKIKNVRYGLASLCIGGGQGGALVLENEDCS